MLVQNTKQLRDIAKGLNSEIINLNNEEYINVKAFLKTLDELIYTHSVLSTLIFKIGPQQITTEEVADFITNNFNNYELNITEENISINKV